MSASRLHHSARPAGGESALDRPSHKCGPHPNERVPTERVGDVRQRASTPAPPRLRVLERLYLTMNKEMFGSFGWVRSTRQAEAYTQQTAGRALKVTPASRASAAGAPRGASGGEGVRPGAVHQRGGDGGAAAGGGGAGRHAQDPRAGGGPRPHHPRGLDRHATHRGAPSTAAHARRVDLRDPL